MNLKELKEIIDIVTSKESIEELELEKAGVRLGIRPPSTNPIAAAAVAPAAITSALAPAAALPQAQSQIQEEKEEELHYVKSPIVGTFFKAPSPNSEAFV